MKLCRCLLGSVVLASLAWILPAQAYCQTDAYGNTACFPDQGGSSGGGFINQPNYNNGGGGFVQSVPPNPVYNQRSSGGMVTLYQDENFQGGAVRISNQSVSDLRLSSVNFNDQTSSIVISSGIWQVCEDANYQGRCRVLGPGRYPTMQSVGLANDSISSVRPTVIRQF